MRDRLSKRRPQNKNPTFLFSLYFVLIGLFNHISNASLGETVSHNSLCILFRWVLKCHACQNVTAEVGRVFCPKCGNGGTLRKVAVTVGENGVVLQARRHRINLRGTKV